MKCLLRFFRSPAGGRGGSGFHPCLVTALPVGGVWGVGVGLVVVGVGGDEGGGVSYQPWTKDSLEREAGVSVWGIGRNVK